MKEITLSIPLEVYTFREAAKKLGTQNTTRAFREHLKSGLRITTLPGGKMRISSIELARYIMSLTEE